jgi:hypothetical protein
LTISAAKNQELMNEDEEMHPEPAVVERQLNNQERLKESSQGEVELVEFQLAASMPQSYVDRWILYLDDIDGARLPAQPSYHCWCEDCWQAEREGSKEAGDPELLARSTAQVREFLQLHEGHDVDLSLECEQEFLDLDQRARNILLREAIYRRHWVATLSDQVLKDLPGVGPKRLKDIRRQIPYSGPAETGNGSPNLKRCTTCYGTGLELNETVIATVVQSISAFEEEEPAPEPFMSIEESLMQISSAIQEINTRLAVLEKDRKEGVSTPRIVMTHDAAAKAVGVRPSVIWDAVMEGDLAYVRMGKGFPMVRFDALQEWLKWREVRMEPEPEPYVTPPELLCRRCGEHEYYGGSSQLKLCRECHQQVKQERIDEKEKKRVERLAKNK